MMGEGWEEGVGGGGVRGRGGGGGEGGGGLYRVDERLADLIVHVR